MIFLGEKLATRSLSARPPTNERGDESPLWLVRGLVAHFIPAPHEPSAKTRIDADIEEVDDEVDDDEQESDEQEIGGHDRKSTF